MKSFLVIILALTIAPAASLRAESFPGENWVEEPSPLASEFAEPGGKISFWASQFPKSFNYTINASAISARMFEPMFETLLGNDPITLEDTPGLARRWEISDDKLEYTFHLNPKAKWSDGKPITADDVVWSFEAMKNPEHLTGSFQTTMKRLISCEAIDERTVKIKANKVHWRNLTAASGFFILPKHWWEKQDFNSVNFEFPVVSGPYRLGEVKEPHFARLERREDYWNNDSPEMEGVYNFDTIEFRFFSQRDTAYEAFRNGDLDMYAIYTSSRWMKETQGERFDKNWIVKQSVYNQNPIGFQGFAMNMRKAPYNDKRVRKALAHLLDRERMNRSLMFNQYVLTNSYYPDLWTKEKPCPNPQIDFNVEKARALLGEAGWEVNASTGKLEKDGKPFVMNFLTRDPSSNKFLFIFEEALNDVGIDLKIDMKDLSAWKKDIDSREYEITWFPWGAIPLKDPEPMWHSSTVDIKQGINVTGFANEKVDELIEQTRELFDVEARHDIVREIDAILFEETPYILLWHIDYVRLLYWNKFGTPEHILGKYTDEEAGPFYWWLDEFQNEDLDAAMENEEALPAPPRTVRFEDVFSSDAGTEAATEPLQ